MKIGDVVVYKTNPYRYRGVYIGIHSEQYAVRFTTCDGSIGHEHAHYIRFEELTDKWITI